MQLVFSYNTPQTFSSGNVWSQRNVWRGLQIRNCSLTVVLFRRHTQSHQRQQQRERKSSHSPAHSGRRLHWRWTRGRQQEFKMAETSWRYWFHRHWCVWCKCVCVCADVWVEDTLCISVLCCTAVFPFDLTTRDFALSSSSFTDILYIFEFVFGTKIHHTVTILCCLEGRNVTHWPAGLESEDIWATRCLQSSIEIKF